MSYTSEESRVLLFISHPRYLWAILLLEWQRKEKERVYHLRTLKDSKAWALVNWTYSSQSFLPCELSIYTETEGPLSWCKYCPSLNPMKGFQAFEYKYLSIHKLLKNYGPVMHIHFLCHSSRNSPSAGTLIWSTTLAQHCCYTLIFCSLWRYCEYLTNWMP